MASEPGLRVYTEAGTPQLPIWKLFWPATRNLGHRHRRSRPLPPNIGRLERDLEQPRDCRSYDMNLPLALLT